MRLALSAACAAVAVLLLAPSAASANTCFGQPATNPGSTTGTSGNDVIIGTSRDDVIDGRGGDDTICGLTGHDQVRGGAGDDRVFGHNGNDDIGGGRGLDEVIGGPGDDETRGGSDSDVLRAGQGNDLLLGRAGDDLLAGGTGDDVLRGGEGFDHCSGWSGSDPAHRCERRGGLEDSAATSTAELDAGLEEDIIEFLLADDEADLELSWTEDETESPALDENLAPLLPGDPGEVTTGATAIEQGDAVPE
jgi:Ca2+-binding RTX toxin-like protein